MRNDSWLTWLVVALLSVAYGALAVVFVLWLYVAITVLLVALVYWLSD